MIARLKGWWWRRRAAPVEPSDDVVAARVIVAAQSRFEDPETRRQRMQQISDPERAAELRRQARNPVGGAASRRAEDQAHREFEAERVYGRDSVQAEATRLGF